MTYVVDASVWVSDIRPSDVNHNASRAFFDRIRLQGEPLVGPSLTLVECAGAISRPTQNPRLGTAAVAIIGVTPNLALVELSEDRARKAAAIAASHALRGADAVYAQVAVENSATLITWDNEMLARTPNAVATMTPSDWLAANP